MGGLTDLTRLHARGFVKLSREVGVKMILHAIESVGSKEHPIAVVVVVDDVVVLSLLS